MTIGSTKLLSKSTGSDTSKSTTERTTEPNAVDRNVNAQCKIVIYDWDTKALKATGQSVTTMSKTTKYDISSRITSCSFSKSLGNASGSFSFNVVNNTGLEKFSDWKDAIKPGTWCLIYMSQDGDLDISNQVDVVNPTDPKRLRCIGYIERVAAKSELNDKGAFDITYTFSGRDFGVIYEETTIWHNLFKYEETALKALREGVLKVVGNTTLDQIIKDVHNLFWKPAAMFTGLDKDASLTELAKQWLLPSNMLNDLEIRTFGPSYYGNIPDNILCDPTAASISVASPLDFLTGNAWDKLKELSIPAFHELFCETLDNGKPQLTFRPIPWAIDTSKYPKAGKFITKFKDLKPRVNISNIDIFSFDLGEDNHNRKNHFLTTIRTSLWNTVDNITHLKDSRFPLQNKDSVARHGFRPVHSDIDSLTLNEMLNDGKPDTNKVVEYNEILYDYWNNAIYFESGTVEMVGNNEIKIGKTIQFDQDVAYIGNKIFYIEEYTDSFIVEDTGATFWTQTLSLTRGAEESDLNASSSFAVRNTKFTKEGDFNE